LHFFENIFESIANQRFANEKIFLISDFPMLFSLSKAEIEPQILQKSTLLQRQKCPN